MASSDPEQKCSIVEGKESVEVNPPHSLKVTGGGQCPQKRVQQD
jgi:hypothetical protein